MYGKTDTFQVLTTLQMVHIYISWGPSKEKNQIVHEHSVGTLILCFINVIHAAQVSLV